MKPPRKIRYHKCSCCGRKAVWLYMPSGSGKNFYCDDCVPRGCSCNNYDVESDGEPQKGCDVIWLPRQYESVLESYTKERRPDSFHYQYLLRDKIPPCCEYDYDEEGYPIDPKITLVNTTTLRNIMSVIRQSQNNAFLRQAHSMLNKECEIRQGLVDYNDFMCRLDHINHAFFDKSQSGTVRWLSERMQPYRLQMWFDEWLKLRKRKNNH